MRDWSPCEVCGDKDGLPHCGSNDKRPGRAGFILDSGALISVCRRCYFRMNARRRRGVDPLGGQVRLTRKERERRAQRRLTERCVLCALAYGPVPEGANRVPKESLAKLGGENVRVCHPCYHWAKRNRVLVQTMTLPELRWKRKKMAQAYYLNHGNDQWKAFWHAKRRAHGCVSQGPSQDGRQI